MPMVVIFKVCEHGPFLGGRARRSAERHPRFNGTPRQIKFRPTTIFMCWISEGLKVIPESHNEEKSPMCFNGPYLLTCSLFSNHAHSSPPSASFSRPLPSSLSWVIERQQHPYCDASHNGPLENAPCDLTRQRTCCTDANHIALCQPDNCNADQPSPTDCEID
jgi:hypothetical protein